MEILDTNKEKGIDSVSLRQAVCDKEPKDTY